MLAAGAAADSLVKALTGKDGRVESWAFEAVPDRVEGANFDVALALYGGGTVYVEVKYTESGFGTAVPDEAHLRKLAEVYRPRLIGKVDPSFLEPANFFPNYQLLRNVSHLGSEADRVVFVVPSGNLTAIEHARTLLDNALAPSVTGVSLVTLEAVFAAVRASATGLLIRHYQEFEEKYLPETLSSVEVFVDPARGGQCDLPAPLDNVSAQQRVAAHNVRPAAKAMRAFEQVAAVVECPSRT